MLEQEINEAIKKNLPLQVGEVLQERLNELARLEQFEQDANAKIKDKEDRLRAKDEVISKQQKEIHAHEDLDKRERDISEKERNYKIALLEKELECQKRLAEGYLGFLQALTKNPIYKETFSKSISTGTDWQNGQNVRYPMGEYTTVTKEVE